MQYVAVSYEHNIHAHHESRSDHMSQLHLAVRPRMELSSSPALMCSAWNSSSKLCGGTPTNRFRISWLKANWLRPFTSSTQDRWMWLLMAKWSPDWALRVFWVSAPFVPWVMSSSRVLLRFVQSQVLWSHIPGLAHRCWNSSLRMIGCMSPGCSVNSLKIFSAILLHILICSTQTNYSAIRLLQVIHSLSLFTVYCTVLQIYVHLIDRLQRHIYKLMASKAPPMRKPSKRSLTFWWSTRLDGSQATAATAYVIYSQVAKTNNFCSRLRLHHVGC